MRFEIFVAALMSVPYLSTETGCSSNFCGLPQALLVNGGLFPENGVLTLSLLMSDIYIYIYIRSS
jgi:hypothetical protein